MADPYCKIHCGEIFYQTGPQKQTLNPLWDKYVSTQRPAPALPRLQYRS